MSIVKQRAIVLAAIRFVHRDPLDVTEAYQDLRSAVLKLPLAHTCPRCHVEPGEYCQFGGGVIDTTSHAQRQVMADAS